MGLIVIAVSNAFLSGCCAIPAVNLYLASDLRGAAFAAFLAAFNAVCALVAR